jgi:hypothetical protein
VVHLGGALVLTDGTKDREIAKPRRLRGVMLGALIGVWLLALAAVGATMLSLLYGWQSDRVRAGVEAVLGELLDHEIRIGRLEGGLLDGLTLHDVSIAESGSSAESGQSAESGSSAYSGSSAESGSTTRSEPTGERTSTDARAAEDSAGGLLAARRIALRVDVGASLRRRALILADVVLVQPTLTFSRVDTRGLRLEGWGDLQDADPGRPGGGLPFEIVIEDGQASDVHLTLSREVAPRLDDAFGRLDLGVTNLRFGKGPGLAWPDTAHLRLDLERARLRDHELVEGRGVARSRGPHVEIEVVELEGPQGGVVLGGELDLNERLDQPFVQTARFAATLNALQLEHWLGSGRAASSADPPDIGPVSGTIDVGIRRIDVSGGGHDYEFDLQVAMAPLQVFGGEITRVESRASVALADRKWSFDESSIELAAGRIFVSGRGVGAVAEQFDVRARALDLARLPRSWLAPRRLAGAADLDLSMHGAFDDPIGMLEIDARNLRVDDIGPGSLDFALQARGERNFVLEAFDWTFERGTGRVAGTRIRSIGAPAIQIGPGTVAIRDLAIDWTGGSMRIDGGIADGLLQPSRIDLDSLDLLVLADLFGIAGEPQGVVSGRLDVSGSARDPEVAARLRWATPRYRGLAAEQIEIDVATTESERRLEAVLTTAGGVEPLHASVRMPRVFGTGDPRRWLSDPRFGLDVQVIDLDLAWLAPLLAVFDLEPAGRLDGRLATSGGAAGPIAVGELRLAGARLDGSSRTGSVPPSSSTPQFGPVTGLIRFEGDHVRTESLHYGDGIDELLLDATLAWSGKRAEDLDLAASLIGVGFRGRADLNAGLRGEVLETSVLSLRDFEVAELARGAGFTGRLGGHLTGELVVHGPIADPDFKTRLTWHEPVVAGVTADELFVDARREDLVLALEGGLERGGRRVLDVKGSLPLERGTGPSGWLARSRGWAGDPATHFEFTAVQFPLDWLPILAPRLPLASDGFVVGSLTLRGDDSVPWIEGELSIEQGVFSLATQTASIGPLSGRIEFDGRSASFDPLSIEASRGRASLAGSVRWSEHGVDDVSVRTTFDGYRFDQLGLLQTTLDGSVLAAGPLDALHLSGEIRLGEVRVSFPDQQNPVLKEIRVLGLPDTRSASIREGEAEVAGIEDRSTVDVAIVLPKGTWIRGIGLDAEIIGAVNVSKAVGRDLHYAGQLEVSHGRYKLQGKRFELDRGVAVFTGGANPIPDVEIEAHRRASREVTVYAHVRGPANAPVLELTSDPPMDTAEIVSYLFFGRSATVGNRESSLGLGESAASVAGSMLVDSVAPELRDTLRIDEISVTSGDDEQAPAVEIETQVTPDVYLRLVQSLGANADEAVEVRWRFWKNLSLKSKVNRTGASAIDLLWEFNYWGLDRYGLDGFTAPPPPPFKATSVEDPEAATRPLPPPLVCPMP